MQASAVRRSDGLRHGRRYLRAFWHRAYQENITGLAGMVAYNLFLAVFPFALLVLFIFGRVIQSPSVEESVVNDLQRLFPAVELTTLRNTLDHIRNSSTTLGLSGLKAGKYTFYCSVDGHRAAGMEGTLSVK